jgi:hypothetical protein
MLMKKQFSNFNLKMLNLWIGLCRGEEGLPSDIRHLGYRHKWIELQFSNCENEAVQPELIIASNRIGHTLLLEWKEGANTEQDQLRRYAGVYSEDLVQRAYLSPSEARTHDTCVLGLKKYADHLSIGVSQSGYSFPLLLIDEDGISLYVNEFTKQELSRLFDPKLPLDFSKVPSQIVPFDHNSEFWEIAEQIVPQIVEYMCRGDPRFTLPQVATDCVPVWEVVMSRRYKKELRTKIKQVIDDAARHEFQDYFERDRSVKERTHTPTWRITYNPNNLPFDKRSREYRKLSTRQRDFVEALRTGKRKPLQLSLGI